MLFSKIPSTSIDAHSIDTLPRQHTVTTEFIIELICHKGQLREMRVMIAIAIWGRYKEIVKTKPPMRVSSACAAELAPGTLLAAMLMGV